MTTTRTMSICSKKNPKEELISFTGSAAFDNRIAGVLYVNPVKAFEEGIIIIQDKDLNEAQRDKKNSAVAKGLKNTMHHYKISGNESYLPEGRILISTELRAEKSKRILCLDGGHRLRAAREVGIDVMVPFYSEIREEKSREERAEIFVKANLQTAMGQADLINASVVSGEIAPIYERFQSARKRGLLEYDLCLSPFDWKNLRKDEKKKHVKFGEMLADLCYGIYGSNTTTTILKKSNAISQEAVDSYCQVYSKFIKIVKRKGIELPSTEVYISALSCATWRGVMARLSMAFLVSKKKKPDYLTPEKWENFLHSLTKTYGPSAMLVQMVQMSKSSGSTGKDEVFKSIVDGNEYPTKQKAFGMDIQNNQERKGSVYPSKDFAYRWRPEVFEDGAACEYYKPRGC